MGDRMLGQHSGVSLQQDEAFPHDRTSFPIPQALILSNVLYDACTSFSSSYIQHLVLSSHHQGALWDSRFCVCRKFCEMEISGYG